MNVTEAVDSLSAMFHPSAQLTQPHLPSYQEFISAFVCILIFGNRITRSSLF